MPPAANLLAPADRASFQTGEPIEVRVDALDRDGKVARVEFWIQEGNFFGSQPKLVSSDTTAPFTATLPTDLPPRPLHGLGRGRRRPRRGEPVHDGAHRGGGRGRPRTLTGR
ncbi:MAG TPA: Ig-like domain-containing protein [Thermoanaerobaculia bacterium]|nr:Ig-like domain-containing protein [Thermoanaerobaculia bacterium]